VAVDGGHLGGAIGGRVDDVGIERARRVVEPLDQQSASYAKTLLTQLDWWARALRTARASAPYPGGA